MRNDTPTFKLAVWSDRNCCFKDGKVAFYAYGAARAAAKAPGKYRISEITRDGRIDGPEFTIAGEGENPVDAKPKLERGGLVTKPGIKPRN